MKERLLFLFFLIFSLTTSVKAEVWQANQVWSEYWENEYQRWVNKNLTTQIFKDGKTILTGLPTDCADALYAIRILFSYEHSLPFVINAPEVLSSQMKTFGNDTSMFDSISDEKKRVRAFINYIGDEVGAYNLQKDTFPVKIKEINSGIIYIVEWQLLGMGKYNQHSYMIKGFDPDHELIYYYSDAPRKVRTLEVNVKYPRFEFGYAPYGYRRWKWPSHLLIPENQIPSEAGYSREQYELVARVGKKQILKEIRDILRN
nr:hypothetical protein BHI3_24350 [Bacteriovorax sp. HI3]